MPGCTRLRLAPEKPILDHFTCCFLYNLNSIIALKFLPKFGENCKSQKKVMSDFVFTTVYARLYNSEEPVKIWRKLQNKKKEAD